MANPELTNTSLVLPSKVFVKFVHDKADKRAVLDAVTSDLSEAGGTSALPLRRGKDALIAFARLVVDYQTSGGKVDFKDGGTLCDAIRKPKTYPEWFRCLLCGNAGKDLDLDARVKALFVTTMGQPQRTRLREPWKSIKVIAVYEGTEQPSHVLPAVSDYLSWIQGATAHVIEPSWIRAPWGSSDLWTTALRACARSCAAAENNPRSKIDSELYVRRSAIEADLSAFLQAPEVGLVLIGESGCGKTTCISSFQEQLLRDEHLVLFLSPPDIDLSGGLERTLGHIFEQNCPLQDLLASLHARLVREGRFLVFIFDAVNEYSANTGHGPGEFVAQIDRKLIQVMARSGYTRFKCVVTCRTKTWESRVTNYRKSIDFDAYYSGAPLVMGPFNEAEREDAFARYVQKYNLLTAYAELSPPSRKSLADPLLLRLTATTYAERRLPAEIETNEVVERFYSEKVDGVPMSEFLFRLANYILEQGTDSIFVPDLEVFPRWQALRSELLDDSPQSLSLDAVDRGILNQGFVNEMMRYRFTYDRFQEFVLAKAMLRSIACDDAISGSDWRLVKDVVVRKISHESRRVHLLSTLSGALHILLRFIHRGQLVYRMRRQPKLVSKQQFIEILQELLAVEDVRLTEIVTGFLLETVPHDAELLTMLGASADRSESASGGILDISLGLLISPNFKAHVEGCTLEQQKQYHDVLRGAFQRALNSGNAPLKIRAIEYIYLLWRNRIENQDEWTYFRDQVEAILQTALDNLGLVELFVRPSKRETFKFLVMLLFLLLAESCEDMTRASRVITFLRKVLVKCHASALAHVPESVIESLANTMYDGFRILPNPVNLDEIEALLGDAKAKSEVKRALDLAHPLNSAFYELSPNELRAFAEHKNSVVRQIFIHALSSKHDLADPDKRHQCINVLEALFATQSPSARYAASIAIYHINYFGTKSSERSIQVMSEMAECILREHHGLLPAPDGREPYNFNILGTFGRVLIKHGIPRNADTLDYALRELSRAKLEQNSGYYEYIVLNMGLLGTLAPPRRVLGVLRYVLEDLGELIRSGGEEEGVLDFERAQIERLAEKSFESLARIRTRFRQEVDRFLLDADGSRRLYENVRAISTTYDLGLYSSWYWEELVQKTLIYHGEYSGKLLELLRSSFFEANNPMTGSIQFVRAFLNFDRQC